MSLAAVILLSSVLVGFEVGNIRLPKDDRRFAA